MNTNTTLIENDTQFNEVKGVKFEVVQIPVRLGFRICTVDEETINTLEGPTTATRGMVVMTGVEGENYAMKEEKFFEKYKDLDFTNEHSGFATKIVKDTSMTVIQPNEAFQAKVWGGILSGKPNDYLIRYDINDFGIIQNHLLPKLYNTVLTKGEG